MKKTQILLLISILIIFGVFNLQIFKAQAGTVIFFPDSSRLQPPTIDAYPNISGNVNWPNVAPTTQTTSDTSNNTNPANNTNNQNPTTQTQTSATQNTSSSGTSNGSSGSNSSLNTNSNTSIGKTSTNSSGNQTSGGSGNIGGASTPASNSIQNVNWPASQEQGGAAPNQQNQNSEVSASGQTSDNNDPVNQAKSADHNNSASNFLWFLTYGGTGLFVLVIVGWIIKKAVDRSSLD